MFGQSLHGGAQDFMPLHALRTTLLKTDQHLAPGSHSRHAFCIGVDSERGVVFQYLSHEWVLRDERNRPIRDGTAGESLVGRGSRDQFGRSGAGVNRRCDRPSSVAGSSGSGVSSTPTASSGGCAPASSSKLSPLANPDSAASPGMKK